MSFALNFPSFLLWIKKMNESTTEFNICPSQTLETSALLSPHDGDWFLINLFSYQILVLHTPTDSVPVSDSYSSFFFSKKSPNSYKSWYQFIKCTFQLLIFNIGHQWNISYEMNFRLPFKKILLWFSVVTTYNLTREAQPKIDNFFNV